MTHIHVQVHHEDDGSMFATVVEYPGVFASGRDYDELKASLEEGIALWKAGENEPVRPIRIDVSALEASVVAA